MLNACVAFILRIVGDSEIMISLRLARKSSTDQIRV